jgi:hypothetical protein
MWPTHFILVFRIVTISSVDMRLKSSQQQLWSRQFWGQWRHVYRQFTRSCTFHGFLMRWWRQGISIPWNVGTPVPDYTMSHHRRKVFLMTAVTVWSHFMQGMRSRRPHNSRPFFSIGINGTLDECVFKARKSTLIVGHFCFQTYH